MFLWIAHSDEIRKTREQDDTHLLEVIRRAQKGEREAFDEIVFHFREQVYAAAWQLTRNSDDAFDVSQDAFFRAYNALGSYKGNSRFSTWLHRIVLNTAVDYLRREKKHRHEDLDPDPADGHSNSQTRPENTTRATQRDNVYDQQLQRHVRQALTQLSTRQRQVFILRYYQELDTRETANVLKCTEGSVKRHLFRAQLRLKELLGGLDLTHHGK